MTTVDSSENFMNLRAGTARPSFTTRSKNARPHSWLPRRDSQKCIFFSNSRNVFISLSMISLCGYVLYGRLYWKLGKLGNQQNRTLATLRDPSGWRLYDDEKCSSHSKNPKNRLLKIIEKEKETALQILAVLRIIHIRTPMAGSPAKFLICLKNLKSVNTSPEKIMLAYYIFVGRSVSELEKFKSF